MLATEFSQSNNAQANGPWVEADTGEIRRACQLWCEPGSVYELRALGTIKGTCSGYYRVPDDLDALVRDAVLCSNRIVDGNRPGLMADGVYLTLNPVLPELYARSAAKLKLFVPKGEATEDEYIVKRLWLPVDLDAERPSGISSTDEQHTAALVRACEVRDYLRLRGWSEPVFADSGNGGHLLYSVDLPNDDAAEKLIDATLKVLARQFPNDGVKVDQSNFNAARIWKLYGTVARKGSNLIGWPHRLAHIIEGPK